MHNAADRTEISSLLSEEQCMGIGLHLAEVTGQAIQGAGPAGGAHLSQPPRLGERPPGLEGDHEFLQ
jgi:hypothetical protein